VHILEILEFVFGLPMAGSFGLGGEVLGRGDVELDGMNVKLFVT